MKNNYIKPEIITIGIDDINIICSSYYNDDINLPHNWYMEDGHIYNPGGKDMCDKYNRPHLQDLWDDEW